MVCVTSFFGDLHGVDSMCISLSDLEDFAKGSAADELEKVEVARGRVGFLGLVGDLELAGFHWLASGDVS